MIPTVTDISHWIEYKWATTTGSRQKCYVENPATNQLYFFKESIEKYQSEFWSEIIASKLGQMLGFNMLDYNIAIQKDKVGCLSQMMIKSDDEELIHGISLIKDSVRGFKVSDRPIVSFQDVETSFLSYQYYIHHFIDIMLFDCLIGNQDRHSENWAINRSLDSKYLQQNQKKEISRLAQFYKKYFLKTSLIPGFRKFYLKQMNQLNLFNYKFAPIYDSGSSLGREIDEESIKKYILDINEMQKYIIKGRSEIRWRGSKMNHFDLVTKIKSDYSDIIEKRIIEVKTRYSVNTIKEMIFDIDSKLPYKYSENALSLQRKELILNFIDYRLKLLANLSE